MTDDGGADGADRVDVVVVGAGLAGLRCAGKLAGTGLEVAVLEASDGVGGRVRTDAHEGFLLDHGFQVLNDAYPEVRRALDVDALQLRRFDDAITVRAGGELHHVVNPLSMPTDVLTLATSSLIPLTQKAKFAAYAATAAALPTSSIRGRRDVSALQAWRDAGLSQETVDRVLRPFFSGVVLDTEFDTSRRFLDLMMRMFVRGRSTLPAAGMQAMPQQLADRLPAGVVRLASPVREVAADGVLTDGGRVTARAVVVATDAWTAHRLVPSLGVAPEARGVSTVYHAAPVWPGQRSRLIVDADGGPVANTVVLSVAAPDYAPAGQALVSSSVLHTRATTVPSDEELLPLLAELHQQDTRSWRRIKEYAVPHALPFMGAPHSFRRPVRFPVDGGTVHVTGDHRDTSSIQGALVSGRRTAESVLASLHRA